VRAQALACTPKKSRFPDLVPEAERRRALARELAAKRSAAGLSQTLVAARRGTAASVVSKLEAGADVKVSTLQRYCGAIGQAFPPQFRLKKAAGKAA
jgi:transcriptional regulator with XRE-family HTH domain